MEGRRAKPTHEFDSSVSWDYFPVASRNRLRLPTVGDMSYARTPYDEPTTPAEMAGDCRVVGTVLDVPRQAGGVTSALPLGRTPVAVSDAAASLANRFSV